MRTFAQRASSVAHLSRAYAVTSSFLQRGGDRNYGNRGGNDRDYGNRGGNDRDYGNRGGNDRDYGNRGGNDRDYGNRGGNDRDYGNRGGNRGGNDRDYGSRGGNSRSEDRDSSSSRAGGRPPYRSGGEGRGADASDNQSIVRSERRIADAMTDNGGSPTNRAERLPPLSAAEASIAAFQLKKKFRDSKTKKEKIPFTIEAKKLISRVKFDMSSQDEKSISLLLNCATFFGLSPSNFVVRECVQWSLQNLNALAPQNVALLAHAVSTLKCSNEREVLNAVSDAVASIGIDKFQAVELLMLLQAFAQRAKMHENLTLQRKIAESLVQKAETLKLREHSTLLDALTSEGSVLADDVTLVGRAVTAVASLLTSEKVAGIHSNNILHFLSGFAKAAKAHPETASISDQLWRDLLARAKNTAGFFLDFQCGPALECVALLRSVASLQSITEDIDALETAILQRIDHICKTFDLDSATTLAVGCLATNRSLPVSVAEVLPRRLTAEFAFQRLSSKDVAEGAFYLSEVGLEDSKFFQTVANYLVGKKPDKAEFRKAPEDGEVVPERQEYQLDEARLEEFFTKKLSNVVRVRLAAERGLKSCTSNEGLAGIVPKLLRAVASRCDAGSLIQVVEVIVMCPRFTGRNEALDTDLLAIAHRRMLKEPGFLKENRELVAQLVQRVSKASENSCSFLNHPALSELRKSARQNTAV